MEWAGLSLCISFRLSSVFPVDSSDVMRHLLNCSCNLSQHSSSFSSLSETGRESGWSGLASHYVFLSGYQLYFLSVLQCNFLNCSCNLSKHFSSFSSLSEMGRESGWSGLACQCPPAINIICPTPLSNKYKINTNKYQINANKYQFNIR